MVSIVSQNNQQRYFDQELHANVGQGPSVMTPPDQVRTYDPTHSVVFLKTNERFGGLSNMAPGFPIIVNGVRIRTSEALYQACRFPSRPDVQKQIIDDPSPMTAKMRSKPFRGDTRRDWEAVRVKVMRWCLRMKLAQNRERFGSLLLSTGQMPIVEKKVRRKDFWGATEMPDGTLVGMNVLGRLLMELREQYTREGNDGFKRIYPLDIPEFLLFSMPIKSGATDWKKLGSDPSEIEPNSAKSGADRQLSFFGQSGGSTKDS